MKTRKILRYAGVAVIVLAIGYVAARAWVAYAVAYAVNETFRMAFDSTARSDAWKK